MYLIVAFTKLFGYLLFINNVETFFRDSSRVVESVEHEIALLVSTMRIARFDVIDP